MLDGEDAIEILPDDPEELFEEVESIGSGNYGAVIKARNRVTDQVVAVKQILMTDSEEMDAIHKEILIMQKSSHVNIVQYYGTYRSLGKLWIAMEYCEGGSVDLVYKILRRPLAERLIAYVCRQVLLGLQYLHANRRIHRDIKGSNILLTRDGGVKLADFGVSTELKHSMSRRNTFIGTVLWMAPEAIQESEYNDKADLWGLGITVIEMAENGPPRNGMHLARALFQIPRDDPPTLKHKDQWSPQMSAFVKRLLTKDKNMRPSATTMLADPFVAPESVGTAEELRETVAELIDKRSAMDSGRLRRGDFSSDTSTATFVERHSRVGSGSDEGITDATPAGGREASPRGPVGGSSQPAHFADHALLPLPLLSTQDLGFDEVALTAGDVRLPHEEADAVFAMLAAAEELRRAEQQQQRQQHQHQHQQRQQQQQQWPKEVVSGGEGEGVVPGAASAAGVRVPSALMHSTRVVAAAYRRNAELQRGAKLAKEEDARVRQRLEKLHTLLRNIYQI